MRFLSVISDFISQWLEAERIQSIFNRKFVLKFFGYALYGVLAFSAFLGLHVVEANLEGTVKTACSKIAEVKVEPVGVSLSILPPKLHIASVTIRNPKTKALLYELQRIEIEPELTPLLSGKLAVAASSSAYGGGVSLFASSGAWFDLDVANIALDITQQTLQRVPFLLAMDKRLQGTGGLHLTFSGPLQNLMQGEGVLSVSGKKLRVSNPVPLVKLPVFEKVAFSGEMAFKGAKLNISKLTVKGNKIQGSLKGTAQLNVRNLMRSKVALDTRLYIAPDKLVAGLVDRRALAKLKAGKNVAIKMSGVVTNPKVSLN